MTITVFLLKMNSFSTFVGNAGVRFLSSVGLKSFSCKCLTHRYANQETKTRLGLENNLALK